MTKHMVSPGGGPVHGPAGIVNTSTFQGAINAAGAGDEIELLPGVYETPVALIKKTGLKIIGAAGVTLDGRRNVLRPPDSINSAFCARNGIALFQMIQVKECSSITIDNLVIQNAWPVAIGLQDSSKIDITRVNFNGATVAILAWGKSTGDLFIERCSWFQDSRIWQEVAWSDIHGDPKPRKELDGDFFRSFDIAGRCVLRYNFISNAFNGIQFFASKGADDQKVNRDVWIYRNTFAFVRDNAVEAEYAARNWWVFENVIFNCHKWFAFEHCKGGHWYVFANRGWFDRKPGPPADCNAGGAVFKTNKVKDADENLFLPKDPVYVFHNSWYLRSTYMKSGKLRNFAHFNNAIDYADPARHPPGLCDPARLMIGENAVELVCSSPGDAPNPFTTDWTGLNIRFFNDVCNHRDFPANLVAQGYPVSGIFASPGFAAARDGDFGIGAGSPLVGSSVALDMALEGGRTWRLPGGRNVGAIGSAGTVYTPLDLACDSGLLGRDYEAPRPRC